VAEFVEPDREQEADGERDDPQDGQEDAAQLRLRVGSAGVTGFRR
jgi:hypothetical protein